MQIQYTLWWHYDDRFEKDDTSMTFIQVAQMVFAKAVI